MTYLVGSDSPNDGPLYVPSRGAGGMLAQYIQGATPKFAKNSGFRHDLYRDTMSRIFVRVEEPELELFRSSVADAHVREQLLPRLIGDPTANAGYIDFVLTEMSLQFSENMQITQGLGDGFVLYTFGQNPPMATFQGVLLNTVQDDQATNFTKLYLEVLRATALARRSKLASIRVDTDIYTGAMMNLNLSKRGATEVAVPFSFQFIITRIAVINYTVGWTPTSVGTPFASDPNAVPMDARLAQSRAPTAVTLRLPGGTVEEGADPRTQQAPPGTPADNAARIGVLEQRLAAMAVDDPEFGTLSTELFALRRSATAPATPPSTPQPVAPQVGTSPSPETVRHLSVAEEAVIGAQAGSVFGLPGAVLGAHVGAAYGVLNQEP